MEKYYKNPQSESEREYNEAYKWALKVNVWHHRTYKGIAYTYSQTNKYGNVIILYENGEVIDKWIYRNHFNRLVYAEGGAKTGIQQYLDKKNKKG